MSQAMAGTGAAPGEGKGLKAGSLGLFGSTVIGLASTAPVYSLAATMGFVVLAVGAQAPIAMALAFIPMFLTASAYRELNRAVPDCGTAFTWGTKAFGPWVGWMAGWGVAVAGIIVLANLAQIGSSYLWQLTGNPDLYENEVIVTATGAVFIAIMTVISVRGLQIGERLQNVLLAVQYIALILFVVIAFWNVIAGTAPEGASLPEASWFNPFAFESVHGFTEAILLCLFIYWGWDTCLALNEETKDPTRTPGRAALLSTVILLVTYVGVTVAAMSYAGLGESGLGLMNADNAEDVFLALKDAIFGPWAWLLVIAVAVSAISSTQTTILPTARGTLSMAVYRALPERFGRVHPKFGTPVFSTVFMSVVAIAFYVGMTIISDSVLQDTILSIGLAIAFYYSITSFACIWYFRKEIFTSGRNFVWKGLFPLLGGVMLVAAFVQSAIDMFATDYGSTVLFGIGGVFVIGVGALALGVVLMVVWFFFPGSKPFFRGESLNRDTAVLVPDEEVPVVRSVDGGLM